MPAGPHCLKNNMDYSNYTMPLLLHDYYFLMYSFFWSSDSLLLRNRKVCFSPTLCPNKPWDLEQSVPLFSHSKRWTLELMVPENPSSVAWCGVWMMWPGPRTWGYQLWFSPLCQSTCVWDLDPLLNNDIQAGGAQLLCLLHQDIMKIKRDCVWKHLSVSK